METKTKIKIEDDCCLREKIDGIYENASQIILAKWSLELAKHILELANFDYKNNSIILEAITINKLWQNGDAQISDVRQAGFKVHRLAKECDDNIKKTALRSAGHAVSSGHMKEHAMVASDYAIKTINLLFPRNINMVKAQRQWQFDKLNNLIS